MESSVANPVGSYTFADIPAGSYTIEVHVPGFAAFRLDNQVVVVGGTLRADARLNVGSVTERMTVAAQGTPKPPDSHTVISSRPIRVGGMVQALRLTYRPDAIYPADLQAQGIQGTVLLSAVISKEGIPTSLHVLKNPGHEEFVTAALDAAGKWRYKPALLNGEPIEVLSNIEIDFKLSGTSSVIDDRLIQ
jgi:TonB family protein